MPYVLRSTTDPTLQDIAAIPQIVIIDLTGPAIFLGPGQTTSLLVGEFLKGPYAPTDVGSAGEILSLYGGVSPLFSQSAAGVQDGSQVAYNGNGMLQLKSKTFKKLTLQRVDCEAVTADGGSTKGTVALTLTIGAGDQSAGVTTKDLFVPAGTRVADTTIGLATYIAAVSQDVKVAKGSTVIANALTVNVNVFLVRIVEPATNVVASSTFDTVIDSTVQGASAGTSITTVAQAAGLWAPGTGTSLAARIESKYLAAIDATLPTGDVTSRVRVIWSARRTAGASNATIQKRLLQNAQDASNQNGQGRVALDSPDPAAGIDATAASTAKAAAKLWASANSLQDDRIIHSWPHTQIFVDEFGVAVPVNPEGWMASLLSNLSSEVNPGVQNTQMQNIVALEPCFVANPLSKQDYVDLLAAGVSPIQKDSAAGWWYVNGVTGVSPTLLPTRVPIKRRMMADEVQATLAQIASPYLKQPATTERVDAFVGEVKAYLDTLLSARDPSRQRIVGYSIDAVSGQDPKLTALGIFTFLIYVKLLPSMDDIVLRTQIGETVTLPVAQAA